MKNKYLIIVAHPDDDILGCGGTLSKLAKKNSIKIIFLGEGSSCRFNFQSTKQNIIKKAILTREKSAKKALRYLGIKNYEFYNLPCGRLDTIPILEINKIIENEIKKFVPDIIFTHSENDCNNDHRIVFRSTMMATRPLGKNIVKKLFSFEILSSSEWNYTSEFGPNYFEILSEQNVKAKWGALSYYKSEIQKFPHPRSKEGVYNLAKLRGSQAGEKYAEAFKLIREFNKT